MSFNKPHLLLADLIVNNYVTNYCVNCEKQ